MLGVCHQHLYNAAKHLIWQISPPMATWHRGRQTMLRTPWQRDGGRRPEDRVAGPSALRRGAADGLKWDGSPVEGAEGTRHAKLTKIWRHNFKHSAERPICTRYKYKKCDLWHSLWFTSMFGQCSGAPQGLMGSGVINNEIMGRPAAQRLH